MSLSIRHFGQLIGETTVSGMAQKLGLEQKPLSVRDMILNFGRPLQPNLHLTWLEGEFNKHTVDHPPNSNNVPVTVEGGVSLGWDDPGKGSQRTATTWTLHFKEGNGQDKIAVFTDHQVGEPLAFNTAYSWSVVPENEFGTGPSSPVFIFNTEASQPSPPPPATHSLTLEVTLSLPVFTQTITAAGWLISGPGAPQTIQNSPIGATSSHIAIPLPIPQGSTSYTIHSTVAFHYDGLVRNNGVSGPEDSQVDLIMPTELPWTGQSRVARFSITYDSSNNVFNMAFAGLFG